MLLDYIANHSKKNSFLPAIYLIYFNFSVKRLCFVLSASVSIPYILKLINGRIHTKYEERIKKFIDSLDDFESAIKKNKLFLMETQLLKPQSNLLEKYDKDNKIVRNLVESIRNVIDGLYKVLKFMELYKIPETIELLYEPIEELKDCELMTKSLEGEIDLKTIKVMRIYSGFLFILSLDSEASQTLNVNTFYNLNVAS